MLSDKNIIKTTSNKKHYIIVNSIYILATKN